MFHTSFFSPVVFYLSQLLVVMLTYRSVLSMLWNKRLQLTKNKSGYELLFATTIFAIFSIPQLFPISMNKTYLGGKRKYSNEEHITETYAHYEVKKQSYFLDGIQTIGEYLTKSILLKTKSILHVIFLFSIAGNNHKTLISSLSWML